MKNNDLLYALIFFLSAVLGFCVLYLNKLLNFLPVLFFLCSLIIIITPFLTIFLLKESSHPISSEERIVEDNFKNPQNKTNSSFTKKSSYQSFYNNINNHKANPNDSKTNYSKPISWNMDVIRNIEWKKFEDLCENLLKLYGIQAKQTPLGADQGIDINIYHKSFSLTKPVAIAQCKARYNSKITLRLVRELLGSMAATKVNKSYFFTSNRFTADAKIFASKNNITLVDGNKLLEWIIKLPKDRKQLLFNEIIDDEYMIPTCPSCGVKLTEKESKKPSNLGKKFWGCVNFPRCRQIINMHS